MRRKNKRLGGVTSDLIADKEVRSLLVGTVKVAGWILIGGLTVWGVGAVVKKVRKVIAENKAQRELEEQTALNKSKLINTPEWFASSVKMLKEAMRTIEGYHDTYNNWSDIIYSKDTILGVLRKLNNKYEWDELQLQFGRIDSHDLREWLGLDDKADVKAYNLILSNMGVSEASLIPNVELRFALWGLPQPIM